VKAIVIHRYGPPEVLSFEDAPDPEPRYGEVRISVHAATVNRVLDVALRAGVEGHRGALLPLIPGVDCAGTIDRLGPGVTKWKIGDTVAAAGRVPLEPCSEDADDYAGPTGMIGINRPGAFAEKVVVPACAVVRVPVALDPHAAAVVLRHAPTAWNLLCNVAELKAGEWVLVMGAGGNLGSMGIQIARNVIGAKVIAVAGSDERVDAGLALGADFGINYARGDLLDQVLKITDGKGVDVLYDNIANPEVLPHAFHALGRNGRLVTAGAHGGPNVTIDFFHLYDKRITIKGMVGYRPSDRPLCLEAAAAGKLTVKIAKVLPLSKAADAHRLMEADPGMGKIVLDPRL
jgi:NADPH2:quinone reductase